jgi:hypothetical protein
VASLPRFVSDWDGKSVAKGYKSRQRWLLERWAAAKKDVLTERLLAVQAQLLPARWPVRCARMLSVRDGEAGAWQPRPGSSSAELMLLLDPLPLFQRRWLAVLLDATTAGPATLIEALERLHLDWRSRLDPLHGHREYATQLAILTRVLGLQGAAEAAYLENEQTLLSRLDELLFESLPMRLRATMLNDHQPGGGAYLSWWYERLLARAGEPGFDLAGIGEQDWPDIPPAWVAIAWLCGLRRFGGTPASAA